MLKKTNIETVWKNNTETVKTFLERRQDYEQLCTEIAYILKKRLQQAEIEFSAVSHRAKSLNSFLEKIVRKNYKNPFEEITDFAGVRIVYLYQDDLKKIETVIKKEFTVIEKVDKLNEKGADKFGYGAIHYIVRIGKNSSGARYEDLKHLHCEIQVKTVLQDAWAIIDHHLVYKRESDIPTALQRKLNSLAGLFETADNQFEIIRKERENYLIEIDKSKESDSFLENEVNLDTFISYLTWKFPNLEPKFFDDQPEIIFKDISTINFKKLSEIDIIIEKYKKQVPTIIDMLEKEFSHSYFENRKISSSLLISTILQIDNSEYLKNANIPKDVREFIDENFKKAK